MKIIGCLTDQGACGWYRIALPLSVIRPDLYQSFLAGDFKFTDRKAPGFEEDLVIVQRVATPHVVDWMAEQKAQGVRYLLEIDDYLHQLPPKNGTGHVYGQGKEGTACFDRAADFAEALIVSTEPLQERYAARYLKPVHLAPNAISDLHLAKINANPTGRAKRLGQVRIGYVGSSTHSWDVSLIANALKRIEDKYPKVTFVFFGQPPPPQLRRGEFHLGIGPGLIQTNEGPVKFDETAEAFMWRYYQNIQALDLDIALAPLRPHVFNDAKSSIKAIEYGACGIPVVASNYGPYKRYASGHDYIARAKTETEWVDALSHLIESPASRSMLAKANLEHIKEYEVITKRVDAWEEAFASLTLTPA